MVVSCVSLFLNFDNWLVSRDIHSLKSMTRKIISLKNYQLKLTELLRREIIFGESSTLRIAIMNHLVNHSVQCRGMPLRKSGSRYLKKSIRGIMSRRDPRTTRCDIFRFFIITTNLVLVRSEFLKNFAVRNFENFSVPRPIGSVAWIPDFT